MKKSKINIVKQETKIILSTDSEYELKQDEDNKSWMEFIDNLIQKKITPTEEKVNMIEEDVYLADQILPDLQKDIEIESKEAIQSAKKFKTMEALEEVCGS